MLEILTDQALAKLQSDFREASIFRLAEFNAHVAAQREAEQRRQAEARAAEERRAQQRSANLAAIRGASSRWLSSEPLAFLILESGGGRVCHYTTDDKEAERRQSFFNAILNDRTTIASEPLLQPIGQIERFPNAAEVFVRMQSRQCLIVMGYPTELKSLLEGIARANVSATAASILFQSAEVNRLSTAERQRQLQAAAEARKEEERARREEEQQARDRERRGVVSVTISCRDLRGAPRPVFQCVMGSPGGGPAGRIIIRDEGQTEELSWMDLQREYGGNSSINFDVARPWRITAQAGGIEVFSLRISATNARGQTVSEEVSRHRTASISD
jgi:hypothetical protein